MTHPTTDNQPAADDRNSTKPRSHRLFWRLVALLVFVLVSTLALIGYRIHRRYAILNLLGPIQEEGWLEIENDYPNWVWNLSGDYIYGLENVRMISVSDAPAEHLRLIKELNPQELYWNRSDEAERSVYRFAVKGGRQIREMTRLKGLWLSDSRYTGISDIFDFVVSDEVLAEIARAPSLEVVRFNNVELQGSPFSALAGSNTIRTVILDNCSYPEADLSQLKHLKSLKSLALRGDQVTEKSILGVAELTQLEELTLDDTTVTDQAVEEFKKAVPGCEVFRE